MGVDWVLVMEICNNEEIPSRIVLNGGALLRRNRPWGASFCQC